MIRIVSRYFPRQAVSNDTERDELILVFWVGDSAPALDVIYVELRSSFFCGGRLKIFWPLPGNLPFCIFILVDKSFCLVVCRTDIDQCSVFEVFIQFLLYLSEGLALMNFQSIG